MNVLPIKIWLTLSMICYLSALSINANAASADEIQVYDDAINDVGELNVDVHMNYVISGIKDTGYPKEIPAHHNFRITPRVWLWPN